MNWFEVVCGASRVDMIVRATIATFESAVPHRIHSCYVIGSYADETGLPTMPPADRPSGCCLGSR